MLKQRLIIITFTLVVFFCSLFLTMPAHKAYQWGFYSSDISMQGISGRYLSGQAKQLKIDESTVRNVSWSWQPLRILLSKLSLNWNINDPKLVGSGVVSINLFSKIVFSDVKLILNGDKLTPYLPKGNSISGEVGFDIELAKFSDQIENIKLVAKAESLSVSTVLGIFDLENIMLSATGNEQDGFNLKIIDYKFSDAVDILIHIKANKITLTGHVLSESSTGITLSPLLPFIAEKQGKIWQINWKGNV